VEDTFTFWAYSILSIVISVQKKGFALFQLNILSDITFHEETFYEERKK
jgi:hypothetical protein